MKKLAIFLINKSCSNINEIQIFSNQNFNLQTNRHFIHIRIKIYLLSDSLVLSEQ